jgi:hypothetical protein
MKFYFVAIISCFLLCMSCSRSKDKVVARVYDEKLSTNDLQTMLPVFEEDADSISIQSYYVDAWILKKTLVHEAKENLSRKEQNFDKELKDYYETLLVFAYENKKVEELLNKQVSDKEIIDYYNAHEADFQMKKNIVKVNYVKFPLGFQQIETAKNLLFKDKRPAQEQTKLNNLCLKNAENMYMENDWLLFDDILKEIPINAYNQEQFLQKNRYIELSDTSSIYLVNIIDFKINENYSPLEMEKENIKNIILDHRRQILVKQIRTNALKKAQDEHEVGTILNVKN